MQLRHLRSFVGRLGYRYTVDFQTVVAICILFELSMISHGILLQLLPVTAICLMAVNWNKLFQSVLLLITPNFDEIDYHISLAATYAFRV